MLRLSQAAKHARSAFLWPPELANDADLRTTAPKRGWHVCPTPSTLAPELERFVAEPVAASLDGSDC